LSDDTTQLDGTAEDDKPQRKIKSYVLRQGRLTQAQQHALEHHWDRFGIDYSQRLLDLNQVFGNDRPVTVEVGFGNGESLLEQAKRHPEQNYIGIEVHGPGVGHLIHFARQSGLSNLRVIRHDAVEVLRDQLPAASISCVQLFFPDPWHKKRHHKRRIIKPEFLELIHQVLVPGGLFHMATDWRDYAEYMLEQMEQADGFENEAGKGNYADSRGERTETRFELRGKRLGHGVWDLMYRKIPGQKT